MSGALDGSRADAPIAIATARKWAGGNLPPDERRLASALERRGRRAEAAVWDDPDADWGRRPVVVLRSVWDYHRRLDEFLAWLDTLERLAVPVVNPAPLVRWNARKTYLEDLAAAGVRVPEFVAIPRGAEAREAERRLDAALRSGPVVVKPVVSASAHETHRVTSEGASAFAPVLARLVAAGDVLVQAYVREIESGGEWSLVHFDGALSHAVRKRPAAGDFRVQSEHGGSVEVASPPPRVLAAAERALRAAPGERPPVYARVDLVDAGEPLLMELELIEPHLFLDARPDAADLFAAAIERRL